MSPPYPSDGVGWGGVGGKSCSHHALSTSLGTSELLGKDRLVEQLLRQGGNLLKLKKKKSLMNWDRQQVFSLQVSTYV